MATPTATTRATIAKAKTKPKSKAQTRDPREQALAQVVELIQRHHLSWDEVLMAKVRAEAERSIEIVREVIQGEEVEYKRFGKYIVVMRDLCGGLPVIRVEDRFSRINAGVVVGMLKNGYTPEQVAEGYQIPLEAVLEADRLSLLFDYERSYA